MNEALFTGLFLWVAFCFLIILCSSADGRTVIQVVIISILLTPLTGFILFLFLGSRRQRSRLRGCPYCLQPVEQLATACHHCLRPITANYIKDKPKPTPLICYCASVGAIAGILIMLSMAWAPLWPDRAAQSTAPTPQVAPSPIFAAAPTPIPESPYGQDWVVVDGEKITGITKVLPAIDGQVTILCAGSGQNVSSSSLPKGFLAEWNLQH